MASTLTSLRGQRAAAAVAHRRRRPGRLGVQRDGPRVRPARGVAAPQLWHDAVWRDVELQYADGAVEASLDGLSLFGKVPVPGFEPQRSWRFALGARTSALSDYHWVDDLRLRRGAKKCRHRRRPGAAVGQRARLHKGSGAALRATGRRLSPPAPATGPPAAERSSRCAIAPASRAWCLATPPLRGGFGARATLATRRWGMCDCALATDCVCHNVRRRHVPRRRRRAVLLRHGPTERGDAPGRAASSASCRQSTSPRASSRRGRVARAPLQVAAAARDASAALSRGRRRAAR